MKTEDQVREELNELYVKYMKCRNDTIGHEIQIEIHKLQWVLKG